MALKPKPPDFIGREALLALRGAPLRKKLLAFVLDDAKPYVWGGDTIAIDGVAVGELSSAGWGYTAGRCIGLGYVRGAAARPSRSTCGAGRWLRARGTGGLQRPCERHTGVPICSAPR